MASHTIQFSILKSNNVMNENEQQTDMNSLPPPILSEILTRIPAKTVFGCMTVSKPWFSLIDNSFFKTEHFSKSNICPLLLFDGTFLAQLDPITMHLIEGENVFDLDPVFGSSKLNSCIEMCKDVSSPRARINGTLLRLNPNATSCEGIICSAPRHGDGRDHVIVFNPVTDEYVVVNFFKCNRHDQGHVSVFIGLGFSRVDERFKLLRISRNKIVNGSASLEWWPEVCIVGTKGWERIEVPLEPMINFTRKVYDVIYVSGMIYWSYAGDHFICSFDFDENVFRVLPLPEMDGVAVVPDSCFVAKNMHMGVLGGSLCVSLICPRDGHVELWTIDKNGGRLTWRKIFDIQTQATDMEHTGGVWTRGNYKAIKYLEGGKILLHDWRDSFLVYDPVTRSDKMFRVLDNAYLNNVETYMNFQVIPHLPSLVPLKDTLNIEDANFVVVKGSRQRSPPRGRGPGLRRSARLVSVRLGKRRGRG